MSVALAFRLLAEDYAFIEVLAERVGLRPGVYVRHIINRHIRRKQRMERMRDGWQRTD